MLPTFPRLQGLVRALLEGMHRGLAHPAGLGSERREVQAHLVCTRAVVSVFDFHWRVAPTPMQSVDRMLLFGLHSGEDPAECCRRKAREAGRIVVSNGLWSRRRCTRVVDWHDHLGREARKSSWAAQVRDSRGREISMRQRVARSAQSVLAGRSGIVATVGKVQVRWQDGGGATHRILSL